MTFQTKVQELLSNRTNKILAVTAGVAVTVGAIALGSYAVKANECQKAEDRLWNIATGVADARDKASSIKTEVDSIYAQMMSSGLFGMMALSDTYIAKADDYKEAVDVYGSKTQEMLPQIDSYREGETCKLPERAEKFIDKVRNEYKFF
jgi:hypothetical protein